MTVQFDKNGADLSTLLSPYVAGHTKAAATGLTYNGADLNTLFDAAAYGTAAGAVGYHQNGTDIGPRFCAFGTARPGVVVLNTGYSTITDLVVVGSDLLCVPASTQVFYTTNGTSWPSFIASNNEYGETQPGFGIASNGTASTISEPLSGNATIQYFGNTALISTAYTAYTTAGTTNAGGSGSIAYGGGVFLIFGYVEDFYATSTNGTAYTGHGAFTGGYPGTTTSNCAAYVNGNFVIGGQNTLSHSTNGTSWTNVTPSGFGSGTTKCAYGGGVYVIGTTTGIWYSTTLATWTKATIPSSGTINALTYTGSVFVYGDSAGRTVYSANGSTGWTEKDTIAYDVAGINVMATFGANVYLGLNNGTVVQVPASTF